MSIPRIYVAGHNGMVGSAIIRILKKKKSVIITKNKSELNLTNQKSVQNFFKKNKVDQIYLAAAKVGGIFANNKYPAEFIYENLMIEANIINSAFLNGVKKILFLGSSCIYPKTSKQPIIEEMLLSGKLEKTNEPYSIAKIAGIKLCESYNRQYGISHNIDYRSLMPTNLYGVEDNYHPDNSHVIPGLIRRFHESKIKKKSKVVVWGSGKQKRDFLNVDDLALAAYKVMNIKKEIYQKTVKTVCSHINVGSGSELTILKLAKTIKKIVNFKGKIEFDTSKPDGMMRKLLDNKRIKKLGWRPKYSLEKGIEQAYKDFRKKEKLNLHSSE